MSEQLWMPLYVADYLKDTQHLSPCEHGAYLLLIIHAWTHDGLLPSDDDKLGRITGMAPKEWKRSKATLLEFFNVVEGGLRHNRVDRELARGVTLIEQRRAAGRASAAARAVQREDQREGQRESNERSTSVATNGQRKSNQSQSQVPLEQKSSNGADSDAQFWDAAKTFLEPERKNPGALIGKWCRDFGREATANAITRAQLERPVERIPFIEGCFRKAKAYDPERITV